MLAQSLRASRLSVARAARTTPILRRTLITPTPIRKADMVQDMYLKEVKAFKPAPVKAGDEKGQVQEFKAPKPPHSPEEADLQNELKAYEEEVPEVEGQSSAGEEASDIVQDWFEEEAEDEEEAHH